MKNISVLLPGIRHHNWERLYNSLPAACDNLDWELVIASPFDLPSELKYKDNITLVKTYQQPSCATQEGATYCKGRYIYLTVDDGTIMPNSIAEAFKLITSPNGSPNDVVNMRYREARGANGNPMPMEYWNAFYHHNLRLPGVDSRWNISLQPMISKYTWQDFGGIDCCFEYSNHGLHDLMFRIQAAGGRILQSPLEGCNADWSEGTSGDHAPIHHAQIDHDEPLFTAIYKDPQAAYKRKRNVSINNYKEYPKIWSRRFKEPLPTTYEEMMNVQS